MADGKMGGARAEQAGPLAGRPMKHQAGAPGRQGKDLDLARADSLAESRPQRLGSRFLGREAARQKGGGRLRRQGGKFTGREEFFEEPVAEPGMGRPDARKFRHVDAKSDDHRRAPRPAAMRDAGPTVCPGLPTDGKLHMYWRCANALWRHPRRRVKSGHMAPYGGRITSSKVEQRQAIRRAQRRESGKE